MVGWYLSGVSRLANLRDLDTPQLYIGCCARATLSRSGCGIWSSTCVTCIKGEHVDRLPLVIVIVLAIQQAVGLF